jgi:hypothetical protein
MYQYASKQRGRYFLSLQWPRKEYADLSWVAGGGLKLGRRTSIRINLK